MRQRNAVRGQARRLGEVLILTRGQTQQRRRTTAAWRKQLEEQLDCGEGPLRETVSGLDIKPLIPILDRHKRILRLFLLCTDTHRTARVNHALYVVCRHP